MIIAKMHDLQLRKISVFLKLFQFRDPCVRANLVRDFQVKGRIGRTDIRDHFTLRHWPAFWNADHLAIIAESNPFLGRQSPEESARRLVNLFAINLTALAGVPRWNRLFSVL